MPASTIRCPKCHRVLAVRDRDGTLEVRQGSRYRVTIYVGQVECIGCNESVGVDQAPRVATLRALG